MIFCLTTEMLLGSNFILVNVVHDISLLLFFGFWGGSQEAVHKKCTKVKHLSEPKTKHYPLSKNFEDPHQPKIQLVSMCNLYTNSVIIQILLLHIQLINEVLIFNS